MSPSRSTPGFEASSVLSRLIPYVAVSTFAAAIPIAVSFSLIRYFSCLAWWASADPTAVPYPGAPMCRLPAIEARSSSIVAMMSVFNSVVALLSSSPLQRLAERIGRKPLLVALALFGSISSLTLIAAQWSNSLPVILALVGLNSITGTLATKSTDYLAGICVADVCAPEDRTPAFTKLAATAIGAMCIGFLGSSRLTGSYVLPFAISTAVYALAAVYAILVLPETRPVHEPPAGTLDDAATVDVLRGKPQGWLSTLLAPVYPLRLLWPAKQVDGGRRDWNLTLLGLTYIVTGCVGGFLPMAVILYLDIRFDFGEKQNGYVMAWFVGSRFLFLTLPFPIILRVGRAWMHRWQLAHPVKQAAVAESGTNATERTPLMPGAEPSSADTVVAGSDGTVVEGPVKLANHFDVIVLVGSLWAEALGYLCLYFATTWQQAAGCFVLLAFGSGFQSALKSLFVASVHADRASESLAALDLLQNSALIVSPLFMGALSTVFTGAGQPALLFLVGAAVIAVMPAFLIPLRRV